MPELAGQLTLFGNDENYKAFTDKFVPAKTTDDCYTPENVYEAVAGWVAEEYGLDRATFMRPFYPGGSLPSMAEVVAAYRSGEVRHYGKQPKQHRVAGKMMTMREAAEMVGVSYDAMQQYVYKHRCSVAKAVKYYEAKKKQRAEREILRILGY